MPSVFIAIDVAVGLREAARAAGLSDEAFVERAVRLLAAQHGIEIAEPAPSPLRPSGVVKIKSGRKGGRPRKAATHEMDYNTPNGEFPRVCPACGRNFRCDNERRIYCSDLCRTSTRNARIYLRKKRNAPRLT